MISNRILKVIFVILLMVIFGELAYYFFEGKLNNESQNRSISQQTQERLISPQVIEYLKNDYIPTLEKIPKSFKSKFYLIQEINGYVGEFKFDSRRNIYVLKINDEKGINLISYSFAKKNIEKKKFIKIFQGTKIPISYKNIKAGQKITVINKDDLTNPSNRYDEYIFTE